MSKIDQITNLYKIIFNRNPDKEGLTNYLNCGLSIEEIKLDMVKSLEYKERGCFFNNNGCFVTDQSKISNLDRFYKICDLYYNHYLVFPWYHDFIKYYYSDLTISEIENSIKATDNYEENFKIRNEIKQLFRSKLNYNMTIISNNCSANYFYKIILNTSVKSPTINSVISTKDFIQYVNNLDYYSKISAQPNLKKSNELGYAVVDVEDLEIKFIHSVPSMAYRESLQWNKRSKLININNLLIIFSDVVNTNDARLANDSIRYNKIIYSTAINNDKDSFHLTGTNLDLKNWYVCKEKIEKLKFL